MPGRALILALAFGAQVAAAEPPADWAKRAIAGTNARIAPAPCPPGKRDDEVIVCLRRVSADRFRLPLPLEREQIGTTGPLRGEVPAPTSVLTAGVACGPFAGQRQCSKAEARLYGYGGGRDPLSLGVRLLTKLVDPDAELPPAPER